MVPRNCNIRIFFHKKYTKTQKTDGDFFLTIEEKRAASVLFYYRYFLLFLIFFVPFGLIFYNSSVTESFFGRYAFPFRRL